MPTNLGIAETLADQLAELGGVPYDRVRITPIPGTATIEDLVTSNDEGRARCELVDGTLVEKTMGWQESLLAAAISHLLRSFVVPRRLGVIVGSDGFFRILNSLARSPDVAFYAWKSLPDGKLPVEPVPSVVPDLVVEVLSRGNTKAEMSRKRVEYFQAGVKLLWFVDPRARTVAVLSSPVEVAVLDETHLLTGGEVLPGLEISLTDLFGELDQQAP